MNSRRGGMRACERRMWGSNLGRRGGVGEDEPVQMAFNQWNLGIRCSGAGRREDGWLEREKGRGGGDEPEAWKKGSR